MLSLILTGASIMENQDEFIEVRQGCFLPVCLYKDWIRGNTGSSLLI